MFTTTAFHLKAQDYDEKLAKNVEPRHECLYTFSFKKSFRNTQVNCCFEDLHIRIILYFLGDGYNSG